MTRLLKSRYLKKRERYCVVISALNAVGRRQEAILLLQNAIKNHRIPASFFTELYIHLSLFLGYPTMLEGLEHLTRYPQKTVRKHGGSGGSGRTVFQRVYGDQTNSVLKALESFHPELASWILRDAYGRVFTRSGMTLRERELSNVATLGVGGFAPQFFSHVRGAVRVGVNPKAIKETLDYISEFAKIDKNLSTKILGQVKKSARRATRTR